MWYSFAKPFNLIRLIRYRFFLFAGLLPFFLGQAIAFGLHGDLNWIQFWVGFTGILFILIAVEFFNEYFDAKEGGDRIFSLEKVNIPKSFFAFGISAVFAAFLIGLYLTYTTGWLVMAFSFVGFMGAYFYVGPPIRWAYRGFGETVIALCYGPFMLLGSYYIQTKSISIVPVFVSLISGLSIFSLAILNEIPDYYQDRLVGKRNLVVRLGKAKAIVLFKLSLGVVFLLLVIGVIVQAIPFSSIFAMILVPWILKSLRIIEKDYDDPKAFRLAVNTMVLSHVVIAFSLGSGFLWD